MIYFHIIHSLYSLILFIIIIVIYRNKTLIQLINFRSLFIQDIHINYTMSHHWITKNPYCWAENEVKSTSSMFLPGKVENFDQAKQEITVLLDTHEV